MHTMDWCSSALPRKTAGTNSCWWWEEWSFFNFYSKSLLATSNNQGVMEEQPRALHWWVYGQRDLLYANVFHNLKLFNWLNCIHLGSNQCTCHQKFPNNSIIPPQRRKCEHWQSLELLILHMFPYIGHGRETSFFSQMYSLLCEVNVLRVLIFQGNKIRQITVL